MTSKTSLPIFWRDPRMPYVELRKVEDGRQVNYALHSHTQWSLGAITAGKSTYRYREDLYIARYLDEQVTEEISLDTLCKRFSYSSGYLIRAFSQHFGMTPHAYLLNRRIQLGRTQLKTGKAIADVAQNVGFADQPHFQRVFKRHMLPRRINIDGP
ncbi:helix-turn-helix domain-containing protein [Nitrincola nitratireducens]|uniref:Regulatory protein soxS n=1 Tax=Nitrincola nitratireducens TaxID=1229521 RepID=W9UW98_9GAMM|nr:Regulatory protein soxS [Nitrincola nitratireducens]